MLEDLSVDELYANRVRRAKIHVLAWVAGSVAITVLWALNQHDAHGSFRHFGSHSGHSGDWNPTLWLLLVGGWGLVVGIKALRVYFERPSTDDEVVQAERVRFHVAAWLLAGAILTPLWAMLEWQDNGGFARWSGNGRPGDWEPWVFYVGAIWGAAVLLLALKTRLHR